MIYYMILTYCLSGQPDKCVRDIPVFEKGDIGFMECMQHAQQVAVEYLHDHPGYFLSRWSCTPNKPGMDI